MREGIGMVDIPANSRRGGGGRGHEIVIVIGLKRTLKLSHFRDFFAKSAKITKFFTKIKKNLHFPEVF